MIPILSSKLDGIIKDNNTNHMEQHVQMGWNIYIYIYTQVVNGLKY